MSKEAIYRKPKSIIPRNDKDRLSKLYDYDILDTPSEKAFDNIARLAAEIFETPSAYVTLVDSNRVYFKSNLSPMPGNEVLRDDSLCSLAILEEQITIFNDTHQVPDLLASPHVSAEGGIRFYAGAPLITPEGYRMGTVCVVDSVPRTATEKQLTMLEHLAAIAINEMESRLAAKKALTTQVDLMNITLHELKSPMATAKLALKMLNSAKFRSDEEQEMLDTIEESTDCVNARIRDLISLSRMEEANFELNKQRLDYGMMLQTVVEQFRLQASAKNQVVLLECPSALEVEVDRARMIDIIKNLLSNAIKFSPYDTVIQLKVKLDNGAVVTRVIDQGPGLSDEDKTRLFVKFARLSAKPTGNESSTGLGLSICKTLVQMHGGSLWAESEGLSRGSVFCFRIPQFSIDS